MGVFDDDVVNDVLDDSTETDADDQGKDTPDNDDQDGVDEGADDEPGKDKPESDEGNQQSQKPKNKLQARFDEMTQQRRAAEARAERAERELAEAKRQRQSPQMLGKPDASKFNNLAEYNIAVAKYNTAIEYTAKHEQADRERSLQAKISSEMGKYENFVDNVRNINDVELDSDVLFEFVMNDPHGVAVLNELGKNRADAIFLSAKSAVEQARLLGKASARIAAQGQGKKVSGAPKPASKVGGGSGSPVPKDPSKMSGDDYAKWRRSQSKKKT